MLGHEAGLLPSVLRNCSRKSMSQVCLIEVLLVRQGEPCDSFCTDPANNRMREGLRSSDGFMFLQIQLAPQRLLEG